MGEAVANLLREPYQLVDIVIEPENGSGKFRLVAGPILPYLLPVGHWVKLDIVFTAEDGGSSSAWLRVFTKDGKEYV
jgi:hypothetical protein